MKQNRKQSTMSAYDTTCKILGNINHFRDKLKKFLKMLIEIFDMKWLLLHADDFNRQTIKTCSGVHKPLPALLVLVASEYHGEHFLVLHALSSFVPVPEIEEGQGHYIQIYMNRNRIVSFTSSNLNKICKLIKNAHV